MSLLGSENDYNGDTMTEQEQKAWELYCEETADDFDVRDCWWDLPDLLQELYLAKV